MRAEFKLQAAIALNNIGVALLHQGCHLDALRAFQNSLKLMREAFLVECRIGSIVSDLSTTEQSNNADDTPPTSAQIIFDASRTLAGTTKSIDRNHPSSMLQLQSVSLDQLPNSSFMGAGKVPPSSSIVFAIRIEDIEFDCKSIHSQYLEYATVLFNISTACRFLLFEQKASAIFNEKKVNKKKHSQAINGGLKCCREAYEIIMTLMEDDESGDDAVDEIQQCVTMLLVLQNLMYLSSESGDRDQARSFYQKFGDIQSELYSEENVLHSDLLPSTAGAA